MDYEQTQRVNARHRVPPPIAEHRERAKELFAGVGHPPAMRT
jgi:hypothetical protein